MLETKVMEKRKARNNNNMKLAKNIFFSATCSSPKKINDTTFPVPTQKVSLYKEKTIQLKFKLNRSHPLPIYKNNFRFLLNLKANEVLRNLLRMTQFNIKYDLNRC